ncbi:MAG: hypothetical protein CM1200mP3_10110 [Chloroflexota bacterium]|nr:MAG: hypothetical protein CM1200mP3_10110 [Chloroflexota bacterium]
MIAPNLFYAYSDYLWVKANQPRSARLNLPREMFLLHMGADGSLPLQSDLLSGSSQLR